MANLIPEKKEHLGDLHERMAYFKAAEEKYVEKLRTIANELIAGTTCDYSQVGKDWSYRQLCTGKLPIKQRYQILKEKMEFLGECISGQHSRFSIDDHGIFLAQIACFILSWLESDMD